MKMEAKQAARIKRYFPGTNSAHGFYSLYHHVIDETASRVFLLKGGPGVGKSTFMKKIGDEFSTKGFELEHHHCSSDPASLDALVIPEIKIALIDATAPHIQDPEYPGVLDEIVDLGEFWNREKLSENRDEIMSLTNSRKNFFNYAYACLAEAYTAYREIDRILYTQKEPREVIHLYEAIIRDNFSESYQVTPHSKPPRSLFAHSITPEGVSVKLDTLLQDSCQVFAVKSNEFSRGVKKLIARIAQKGWETGLKVEKLHCPFDPEHLDGVLLPELSVAVINTSPPFHVDVDILKEVEKKEELNLIYHLNSIERQHIQDTYLRMKRLLEDASYYLRRAQQTHQALEKYYVEAMDFSGVEDKRQELMGNIHEIALDKYPGHL